MMATKREMVTAMRVAGDEEGTAARAMAMATRVSGKGQQQGRSRGKC